jgi:hypothetical protein
MAPTITGIVIVAPKSNPVTLYLDWFSQMIVNLIMKNVHCACGTYYNGNCNGGTKITCSPIGIVQLVPVSVFTWWSGPLLCMACTSHPLC